MRINQELLVKHCKSYRPGDLIFREGDMAEEMYVVLRGEVHILKELPDSRKVLKSMGEGDMFGEMALVDRKPRSATAEAATDTDLFVIKNNDLEKIVSHQPDFVLKLVRILSSRLREADGLIQELLTRDRKNMVVSALIEYARSINASRSFRGQKIQLRHFLEQASGQIGLTPMDILEQIGYLEKEGLVTRSNLQEDILFLEDRIDRRS